MSSTDNTKQTTAYASRVPFISGDEQDALTKTKRIHVWRAGERTRVKRGYWKRFRGAVRAALKGTTDGH